MWRIVLLGVLGLIIGSRAQSERGVVLTSLFLGLVFGGLEVMNRALLQSPPSPGGTFLLLGLGLVMAAPVYAVGELWRRARTRALGWLRRLIS